MRLNKLFYLFSTCIFLASTVSAQNQDYVFPIKPGQKNFLAGTMGELRSSHYHGGIDIKTEQQEGFDVLATQDGYVSRIKVSGYGYGNALYVQHPDGNTSVYGHLQRFREDIADYVRTEQYKRESFGVDLYPDKNMLPVKKGDVIAVSGNSGGSSGPHLHFEIRNRNQQPLNPLTFGFQTEIEDNLPPTVQGLAISTLTPDSRVNGLFGRQEIPLKKEGNSYKASEPVSVFGTIGVKILTIDQLNGASNKNGVPRITLCLDSTEIFAKNLDKFSFSDTRQILVHMDYPTKAATGKKYQKLYIDDGNTLKFFNKGNSDGRLRLTEPGTHTLQVKLEDAYGNQSEVVVPIEVKEAETTLKRSASPYKGNSGYEQRENILLSYAVDRGESLSKANYYVNQVAYEVDPAYQVNDHVVYLWDLRNGLPDSVNLCSTQQVFQYDMMVPSGREFHFFDDNAELHFAPNTLFDTLYLRADYQQGYAGDKELWTVNDTEPIPMQSYITAVLKPSGTYDKEKTHVYAVDDAGNFYYEGGKWEGNHIRFRFRNTGKFTLVADSVPPVIKALKVSPQSASFSIKDALSGIGDFHATLNGSFLLMNYDPKNRYIWAEPRTPGEPMKGELELTVTDQAGNKQVYKTKL